MSTGGTLTATVVAPTTPSAAPPSVRRKPVAENWDDDFEFSFPPPKPKTPARKHGLGIGLGESSRDNTFPKALESPDSFDEDWDDPIPGPSRSPSRSTQGLPQSASSSALPSRSNSSRRPAAHLALPRSSQSQSPTLPPPSPATSGPSRTPRPALVPSSSTISNLRVAGGDGSSPVRSLSKRSSTSFLSKSESGRDLSLHGASPAHKSSPNLAEQNRVASRGMRSSMLPSRPQSPTKGVLKTTTASPAKSLSPPKASELHSSPSSEQIKKAKFWKRLSAGASGSTLDLATPPRRPRSSSVANPSTPSAPADAPPVPPLPPNLRTPSVGSTSGISAMSSSPSSTTKTGPVKRLSAMLRRSSSNLSAALKQSSPSPPPLPRPHHPYAGAMGNKGAQDSSASVYTMRAPQESSASVYAMPNGGHSNAAMYAMRHAQESSASVYAMRSGQDSSSAMVYPVSDSNRLTSSSASSVNLTMGSGSGKVVAGGIRHSASRQSLVPTNSTPSGATTPRRPSPIKIAQGEVPPPPRTFSPGFHLPNTVAGSPYRTLGRGASPLTQGAGDLAGGSDTETEEDHGGSTTPKRRRRVRPVSVQPAPRQPDALLAARFKEVNASVPVFASSSSDHRKPSAERPQPVSIPSTASVSSSSHHSNGTDPKSPTTPTSHASMHGSNNSFGHTTLKRLTSFSKKHGRRLSGGWKFGSTSSASSIESEIAVIQQAQVVHRLEPVAGSPSKLPIMDKDAPSGLPTGSIDIGRPTTAPPPPVPVNIAPQEEVPHKLSLDTTAARKPSPDTDTLSKPALDATSRARAGSTTSVSRPRAESTTSRSIRGPKSLTKSPAKSPSKSLAKSPVNPKHVEQRSEVWDDWDEPVPTASRNNGRRERRRMSFNDFVIPDSVLAKQKELKRGIGAVKKFAGGVDALKNLVESHERVCNYILASGSQAETRLFVALENEYAQWWEMATVLIEVGSTGTDGASASNEVNSRRVTLATEDARAASEALRSVSGTSTTSFATAHSGTTVESNDVFAPNGPPRRPEFGRASTGRHDLSKRQLEVLRTMLRTPVADSDTVVPSVDQRQVSSMTTRRAKHMSMPAVPVSIAPPPVPTPPRTLVAPKAPAGTINTPSPGGTYIFPSPGYPSPTTAAALAQPKKTGLAGLREFLRSLKKGGSPTTPTKPRRNSKPPRKRPAPINLAATEKYHPSPPGTPLPTAIPSVTGDSHHFHTQRSGASGSRSPTKDFAKKRRPSLKSIFRPGSGNWADLVRSTPPASPFVPDNGSKDSLVIGREPSAPATPTRLSPVQATPRTLQRPPSVPALARIKQGKQGSYASLSVDADRPSSPTKSVRHRPSVGAKDAPPTISSISSISNGTVFPAQPPTPTPGDTEVFTASPPPPLPTSDSEATLRLKSRIMGLGHPSESSPSTRTASSPARPAGLDGGLAPPAEETPRSRSDHGPRANGETMIALTPENLPVLLDYVQQCERRLDEWRRRADRLGVSEENTPATSLVA